jgi:hypothetical protein
MLESVDEFSTKGHAGMKVRPNDPRFADNPMSDPEELDEFTSSTMNGMVKLDRLHDIFRDADISDQELKQGIQLSDAGLHKVAGALGTSPDEIKALIASLTQHIRDEQNDEDEQSLQEQYRRFIEAEDHLSAEPDFLGDVTIRSAKQGREKFYQGSKAATITKKLDSMPDDAAKQEMLRPLIEDDENDRANERWKADRHNADKRIVQDRLKTDQRGKVDAAVRAWKPNPTEREGDDRMRAYQQDQGRKIAKRKHGAEQRAKVDDNVSTWMQKSVGESANKTQPLAEGFTDEIASNSGSYNFPWKVAGQSGFGTMQYSVVSGKPSMRLISVRDTKGDDLDADKQMRHQLLIQARNFIPDA